MGASRLEQCTCQKRDANGILFASECACPTGSYLAGKWPEGLCMPCASQQTGKYRTTDPVSLTRGSHEFSSCTKCVKGYYGSLDALTNCTKCPEHSSGPEGAFNIHFCECKAGYYMNGATCARCPKNSDTTAGVARDITGCKCKRTHWLDSTHERRCRLCPKSHQSAVEGATSPTQCICLSQHTQLGCLCGKGKYRSGSNLNTTCRVCPNERQTPTDNATAAMQCSLCPSDTYGSPDVGPCTPCGKNQRTLPRGENGHTTVDACSYCVADLCGAELVLTITLIIFVCLLWLVRYCVMHITPWPRLPVIHRKAFVSGIGNYLHYADLPGAFTDATHMFKALSDAAFDVSVFNNIDHAKNLKALVRQGNFMDIFSYWTQTLRETVDVVVFFAGHGIRFQGQKWLVTSKSLLRTTQSVIFQCVQLDWMRVQLASKAPRVSVFVMDCCDVEVSGIKSFLPSDDVRRFSRQLPSNYTIVDIGDLHSSSSALNTYIFHGAARATKAKEASVSGGSSSGAFTSSFIKYMQQENTTLDELSEKIRSDMTRQYVQAKQSKEVSSESRAAKEGEGPKARSDSMQIAPTENYLEHELRGWCFFESDRMCFGYVTPEIENAMRCLIHMDCLSGEPKDARLAAFDTTTSSERSVGRDQHDTRARTKSWSESWKEKTEDEGAATSKGKLTRFESVLDDGGVELTTSQMQSGQDQRSDEEDVSRDVQLPPLKVRRGDTICELGEWKEYQDEEGRTYYYNTASQESQWEKPGTEADEEKAHADDDQEITWT